MTETEIIFLKFLVFFAKCLLLLCGRRNNGVKKATFSYYSHVFTFGIDEDEARPAIIMIKKKEKL